MGRILLTALFLLPVAASPALAQGAAARAPWSAPTARFVDGVKVGSSGEAPKHVGVRTSRCSSGCTLLITR